MKFPSYLPSECCGSRDCDYLDASPDQPCWGQVEGDSAFDDEDGRPLPNHLCQGHKDMIDWYKFHSDGEYIPEHEPDSPPPRRYTDEERRRFRERYFEST